MSDFWLSAYHIVIMQDSFKVLNIFFHVCLCTNIIISMDTEVAFKTVAMYLYSQMIFKRNHSPENICNGRKSF
jgi:hypothetical protein